MKKRVVALVLCLVMALSLLSTTTFAAKQKFVIDTIYLTVDEPVAGNTPDYTAQSGTSGVKTEGHSVYWYHADGTEMKPTEKFVAGQYYDVEIFCEYSIRIEYPYTVYINGKPAIYQHITESDADHYATGRFYVEAPKPIHAVIDDTANVGEPVDLYVSFAECGIYGGDHIVSFPAANNTMAEYGLKGDTTAYGVTVKGTPTKAGTATFRVEMESQSTGVTHIIDVTLEIKSSAKYYTVTDTAVVGQEYDGTLYFADYGMKPPYCDTKYYDMQSFGMNCNYTGTYAHVYGTPTKEGTTICRLIDNDSTPNRILDIIITVQPAKLKITRQPKSVSAAAGTPVTFSVEATGTGTLSYEWFAEKGSQTSALGKTKELSLTANAAKSYSGWKIYCKVSDSNAAVVSEKAVLTITEGCPFADVFPKDWFYNDVMNAVKMGLINGKTPTLFKPNDNMTYAEAIKLAACMNQYYYYGQVTLGNGSPNWYDSYVEYARNNGIPWEYKNYNATISRADYVHIFYHALPQKAYGAINYVTGIPDVGTNHQYFEEIRTFYNAGILTGNDAKGTFNPNSNIKRSEVAAILSRMMDESLRKTFILQ